MNMEIVWQPAGTAHYIFNKCSQLDFTLQQLSEGCLVYTLCAVMKLSGHKYGSPRHIYCGIQRLLPWRIHKWYCLISYFGTFVWWLKNHSPYQSTMTPRPNTMWMYIACAVFETCSDVAAVYLAMYCHSSCDYFWTYFFSYIWHLDVTSPIPRLTLNKLRCHHYLQVY